MKLLFQPSFEVIRCTLTPVEVLAASLEYLRIVSAMEVDGNVCKCNLCNYV